MPIKTWVVFHPIDNQTSYKSLDQSFTTSFNNDVGTSVRIKMFNMSETLSGSRCTDTGQVLAAGTNEFYVNNMSTLWAGTPLTVAAGSAFSVKTVCNGAAKKRGDPYEMTISINYESVIGGMITPHTEIGSIKGTAE